MVRLFAELADQLADLADLVGVEAVGRLVEDQQFRVVDQGVGQADPLAVALREGLDHPRRTESRPQVSITSLTRRRASTRLSPLSRARNLRYSRTRISL